MIKEVIPSSKDCCCSEPVTLIRKRDSMSEIFAECGKNLGNQARQVLQLVRKKKSELLCKPYSIPKTRALKANTKCPGGFWKRFSLDEWLTGLLVLTILLMLFLGLFLVRSYNLAQAYGTGGCLWPVLWGQCQIMT